MKVYIAQCEDKVYADYEIDDEIFLSEKKAKQFCETRTKADHYDWHYEEKETADDNLDVKLKDIKNYYFCELDLKTGEFFYTNEDAGELWTMKDTLKSYSLLSKNDEGGGMIRAYSIKSLEHAKEIAIKEYQKYWKVRKNDKI